MAEGGALQLGPEAVRRLLPHRPPMLMVDGVDGFVPEPRPWLAAHRELAEADPVFAGHFPGRPVWPGALIIEGLAQSCQLLALIEGLRSALLSDGFDPHAALLALRALDGEVTAVPWLASLPRSSAGTPATGLLALAEVRFVEPVVPPARLDYAVAEAKLQPAATLRRFEVDATCGGRSVARGTLVVTRVVDRVSCPAPP